MFFFERNLPRFSFFISTFLAFLTSYNLFCSPMILSSIDLSLLALEFRPCRGDESESQRWFLSFLNRNDFKDTLGVENLSLKDLPIRGSFSHENFGGESFVLGEESSLEPLKRAYQERPLYSIWDFISCEKGEARLVFGENGVTFIQVSGLQNCFSEWGD